MPKNQDLTMVKDRIFSGLYADLTEYLNIIKVYPWGDQEKTIYFLQKTDKKILCML